MMDLNRSAFLAVFLFFSLLMSTAACADDPLRFYVGGSVGLSHVRTEDDKINCCDVWRYDERHAGWKAYAGARPLSFLGLELAYTDFGHTSAPLPANFVGFFSQNSKQNAATVFGIAYLPLPAPTVDIYGKVGVARLHTEQQTTTQPYTCPVNNNCLPYTVSQDQRNINFTYGAGVQARFGPFAVRAEYERINTSGGDPDLLSVGLAWRF